jgi:hypothetical protein
MEGSMAERKQCLILGPMRTSEDKRKMFALQQMLQKAFNTQRKDYDVINPYDGKKMIAGDIIDNVINEIDRAEIVVINITGSNPNVLYETAICHALGVPCILISENLRKIPFYLNGYRCEEINFDEMAESTNILIEHIVNFDKDMHLYLENPIRKHFTRSIVDISPAIGVAQGYYYNLIRHARNTLGEINSGVWKHRLLISVGKDERGQDKFADIDLDIRKGIKKYRVIIPTRLKYTKQEYVDKVTNYKDCVKGQMILRKDTNTEKGIEESRPYGITFHRVGENQYEVVDVPTSMNPMIESIGFRMRVKSKKQIDENHPDWRHYEDEEINRFQNELEELLREYEAWETAQGTGPALKGRIEIVRFNPDDTEEVKKNSLFWLLDAFLNT